MKRIPVLKAIVAAALPLLFLADVSPGTSSGLTLVRAAHAVVGAPMTPMSVAGVARRTTAVAVTASAASASAASQQQAAAASQQQAATAKQQAATAEQQAATAKQQAATSQQQAAAARPPGAPPVGSVSSALPAGCKPENRGGVEYQSCGGVTYRAAFQGNNLVYVVQ